MINLNKFKILLLIILFLNGCSSITNSLSLKKKAKIDEFLVEKKDPLILPPDFEKLPVPRTLVEEEDKIDKNDENFNIKNLLKKKSEENLVDINVKKSNSSVKDAIMKKINKN